MTVDQGLLGTKVDVCSGNRVDEPVWTVADSEAETSRVALGTDASREVAADNVVAASEGMISACHVQIHPVFVGSTEQIISDVHVRMVFHLSSKHPVAASQLQCNVVTKLPTLQLESLASPSAIRAFLPLIEYVIRVAGVDDLGEALMSGVVTSSRKVLRWQGDDDGEESQKEDGRGGEWAHCE